MTVVTQATFDSDVPGLVAPRAPEASGGGRELASLPVVVTIAPRAGYIGEIEPAVLARCKAGDAAALRRFIVRSQYVFFFLLPWLPEWWHSRRGFGFTHRSLADDGLAPEVIDDLLEGVRRRGRCRRRSTRAARASGTERGSAWW